MSVIKVSLLVAQGRCINTVYQILSVEFYAFSLLDELMNIGSQQIMLGYIFQLHVFHSLAH